MISMQRLEHPILQCVLVGVQVSYQWTCGYHMMLTEVSNGATSAGTLDDKNILLSECLHLHA